MICHNLSVPTERPFRQKLRPTKTSGFRLSGSPWKEGPRQGMPHHPAATYRRLIARRRGRSAWQLALVEAPRRAAARLADGSRVFWPLWAARRPSWRRKRQEREKIHQKRASCGRWRLRDPERARGHRAWQPRTAELADPETAGGRRGSERDHALLRSRTQLHGR